MPGDMSDIYVQLYVLLVLPAEQRREVLFRESMSAADAEFFKMAIERGEDTRAFVLEVTKR